MEYFTPLIEDIRVGYECELLRDPSKDVSEQEWMPFTFKRLSLPAYCTEKGQFELTTQSLRVPYLTKEQVEAEGWKITYREIKPNPYKVDWINAKKGDYDLWINLALHDKMHLGVDRTKWGILYRGQCKDINTFRQICKLLGV